MTREETIAETLQRITDDKHARSWRGSHGRSELAGQVHIPLGWVPLCWTAELRELLDTGVVRIVDLPRRAGAGTAKFLVVNRTA